MDGETDVAVTARARAPHGPCDTCGHPILEGQSFMTGLMRATKRRAKRGFTVNLYGREQLRCKVHAGCPHPDHELADRHGPWQLVQLESPRDRLADRKIMNYGYRRRGTA